MKTEKQITIDEDSESVSLCKKGDISAFEALIKKYQKKVFNIAFRMIGNYDDACEVAQDTFVSAYRSINKFKGMSKFSTWLHTITVNLSKNKRKQLGTRKYHEQFSLDNRLVTEEGSVSVEPVSADPSPLEGLEQKETQQKIQNCINKLADEFREVLILRDMQGFSYEEIGAMLNVAQGTVKSRLFRAREDVKELLKKVLGEL